MPSLVTSGTQSATVTTEHDLATDTGNATYVLVVDAANMQNGDVLELRLYTKVLSGDSSQLAYYAVFSHVQTEPNKYSVPVPANIELRATLEQAAGTSRSFKWALLSL